MRPCKKAGFTIFLWIPYKGFSQRYYQRWLDKRIYKTEMKFWAAISMQLFGMFLLCFQGQKIILIFVEIRSDPA